jgi:hypothetical protein
MRQRGRKSLAAVSVRAVTLSDVVPRPDAPGDLTNEQAAEWRAVVDRMPADWFQRETHALLAQYCRHVVAARRISELIRGFETELARTVEQDGVSKLAITLAAAETLDRLLKMQEREGRAMSSLATRMRLTQQTSYDKTKPRPIATKPPWEF